MESSLRQLWSWFHKSQSKSVADSVDEALVQLITVVIISVAKTNHLWLCVISLSSSSSVNNGFDHQECWADWRSRELLPFWAPWVSHQQVVIHDCHHTWLLIITSTNHPHHLCHLNDIQCSSNVSVSKRSASRCSETSQTLTEEPEVAFHLLFYGSFKHLQM